MKTLAQTCAIETFEKTAALAFFKIPRYWMTTTRKHFAYKQNITSFAVKTQLTPFQWKLLHNWVSGAWDAITERSRFESASRQWWLIDLTNQRAWYHMEMSKRACRRLAKLTSLNCCWNTSGVFYSLLATPPQNLILYIYTKLMHILRMLFDRPFKKIRFSKGHLARVIFLIIASRLKYICHIQPK